MIIGLDYHPSFQAIAFLMEETGECGEQELNHSGGEAERSLPSVQGPLHSWKFARRNALAGASRHSNRLNHLRTNWIFKPLTMIRIPFVYHRQDLLEIQFFKTTSEGQGSRVFGSREQTTRPPAVEKKFAFGGQVSPKVKLLD